MKNKTKIAILLSTYNGEKFISEQLQSLLNQTFQDFTIYIRDDGSHDLTISICEQFAKNNPHKIILLASSQNIGAKDSFGYLTETIASEFYMYCDQDDFWLPQKIEDTYNFYSSLPIEQQEKPLLIYTDAKIVDKNLNIIANSLVQSKNKIPNLTFNNSIFNGACLGCTTFFNHQLRQLIIPMPKESVMHDSWLTKVALLTGNIQFLDKATLLYRQHDNNIFGTNNSIKLKKLPLTKDKFINSHGFSVYKETLYVLRKFSHQDDQKMLLNSLETHNFFSKLCFLINKGYINRSLLTSYKTLIMNLLFNK